jgi:PhzF family phenazine biosynthesis protein
MNLSETAFLRLHNDADSFSTGEQFGLRWFTPFVEVPLCGHATLASAAVLFRCIENKNASLTFHTLSGQLTAVTDGDFITLDMPHNEPQKLQGAELTELSELISASIGDLKATDVQYSQTTRKLLIRLADTVSIEELQKLKPKTDRMTSLESSGKVRGVIITVKGSDKYDFASRYFAPWVGIAEDPVTGSAHTVLGPYWSRVLSKTCLNARQCSARGGDLRVTVRPTDRRVDVAGRAVVVLRGTITTASASTDN